ncbi:MAG: DNA-3-methyladenine glycosylase family protein [Polyangiaceae bacterium]
MSSRKTTLARGVTLGFDPIAAASHLASRDAKLGEIIDRVGPLRLELAATKTTFEALAESIVYQQLTGKAAATIHGRLCALFDRRRPRPDLLLTMNDDALRGVGLSRGKVLALRDLAARTLDGTVPTIGRLRAMTDQEVVERLVQVRGVGPWTAEMLLIFRLGRPDVLPVHDYGVRQGFKLAYRMRELPAPKTLARRGEKWRPFRTAASWYLWRAVDLSRRGERGGRASSKASGT